MVTPYIDFSRDRPQGIEPNLIGVRMVRKVPVFSITSDIYLRMGNWIAQLSIRDISADERSRNRVWNKGDIEPNEGIIL
jgi:hypothetical protein